MDSIKYRKKSEAVEVFQMTKERRLDKREWPWWMKQAWEAGRFWNDGESVPGAIYLAKNGKGFILSVRTGPREIKDDYFVIKDPCSNKPAALFSPDVFKEEYEPVK